MSDFYQNSEKDKIQMTQIFDEVKKTRQIPEPTESSDSENDIKSEEKSEESIQDIFTNNTESEINSEADESHAEPEADNNVIFYHTIKKTSDTEKISKKKISGKRLAINITAVILGVLMILVGSGFIIAYSYFTRINYQAIDTQNTNTPSKNNSSQKNNTNNQSVIDVDYYDGPLLNDPMILNILLFGADTRSGSDIGNSDTIILLSLDTRHQKIKLTSFMRDTYVSIPGYDDNRVNAAYAIGGEELAVKTIQANYGIKIDRYAVVDFKSFKKIINTLGGIDVELTAEEIDYINWQCWVNNQVETRYELDVTNYTFDRTDSEGNSRAVVHLNGRQALWHARNRGEDGICSGDDYTRTQRQRQVISILMNRLKQSDSATVMSIIYEIGPFITTNLKTSEITKLATNITKYLKYDMVSTSMPQAENVGIDFYYSDDYNPIYIAGWPANCIVIYNWDDFRRKVASFIFEEQLEN